MKWRIANLREFKQDLKKVDRTVSDAALRDGCNAGAFQAIARIKVKIDDVLHRRTGNLIGSVMIDEIQVNGHKAWVTFGPHTVYAAIHEFGGVIRATNAPALVFEVDGQLVITKSVQIPARPYIRPTMDQYANEIAAAATAAVRARLGAIYG